MSDQSPAPLSTPVEKPNNNIIRVYCTFKFLPLLLMTCFPPPPPPRPTSPPVTFQLSNGIELWADITPPWFRDTAEPPESKPPPPPAPCMAPTMVLPENWPSPPDMQPSTDCLLLLSVLKELTKPPADAPDEALWCCEWSRICVRANTLERPMPGGMCMMDWCKCCCCWGEGGICCCCMDLIGIEVLVVLGDGVTSSQAEDS